MDWMFFQPQMLTDPLRVLCASARDIASSWLQLSVYQTLAVACIQVGVFLFLPSETITLILLTAVRLHHYNRHIHY